MPEASSAAWSRAALRRLGRSLALPWPARLRRTLRRRFAPPTLVLLYHRVVPDVGHDANQLAVSCENFAAQLACLRESTRPLGMPEFLAATGRSAAAHLAWDGKPRVLVTFDDGYADNYRHALPLLLDFGMSATVFATSGLIGTDQPFWWDALEQVVWAPPPRGGHWRLPDGNLVPADRDPHIPYGRIHAALKPLAPEARQAALTELAAQARAAAQVGPVCNRSDDARPMTWEELRVWQMAGMTVGAHTRTHPQLAALETDALQAEVRASKQELETQLGTCIETLAYPYGVRADVDARVIQAARDAGFRCAFVARPGYARWAKSQYAIPRYLVRDWPAAQLAARLTEWCAA